MSLRFLSAVAVSGLSLGLLFGSVGLTPASATEASENAPQALRVTVDRAKVVRIARSAKTIIIGNPLIVSATIQDSQTIVLTGRSFGVTNLIIMDGDGEPIVDETVVVGGAEQNTVRIYRRTNRETLACSPVCEPTLTIGDQASTFDNSKSQIESRNSLSTNRP